MKDGCSIHGCNKIILDDTDEWAHPVCLEHWELMGQPALEPNIQYFIELSHQSPRLFDYRRAPVTAATGVRQP